MPDAITRPSVGSTPICAADEDEAGDLEERQRQEEERDDGKSHRCDVSEVRLAAATEATCRRIARWPFHAR